VTPVDMTILNHNPKAGIYGDCFRCCIASLLELSAARVPHFMAYDPDEVADKGQWFPALNAWLRPKGFSYVDLQTQENPPEKWFAGIGASGFVVYHVLSGKSERGFNHSVVAKNGVIVHDPHPSRSGLIGPDEDGIFSVGLLVAHCEYSNYADAKTMTSRSGE